jgi:putative colanic acid biosynthesis acetyltransferase WcaF
VADTLMPLASLTVSSPTASDLISGDTTAWVDLASFRNPDYDPGRGRLVRAVWYLTSLLLFESGWFPFSGPKSWLLRCFGARVGAGLVIRPRVRIKYPWRLTVGDHCWIGQSVWIDNLADVELGSHVCVSQLVYLCTGSHDYRRRTFDLLTGVIRVDDGAWLGARCLVLGGVTVHANAVVAAGSVVTRDVARAAIVAGSPAKPLPRVRERPTS